jgi:hypothetical protein
MSQAAGVHESPASPCSPASTLHRKPRRLPPSRASLPVHGVSATHAATPQDAISTSLSTGAPIHTARSSPRLGYEMSVTGGTHLARATIANAFSRPDRLCALSDCQMQVSRTVPVSASDSSALAHAVARGARLPGGWAVDRQLELAGRSERFYSHAHRGWSRSREIFGACGRAAGGGYPVCGAAFGVRAGLRAGWMVAGCP